MYAITSVGQCSAAAVPQPRLVQAAHEFEAQLMKELLRPLTVTTEDDAAASSGGALNEFAGETLGQALSRSGGFGISAGILRSLSHNGDAGECVSAKGTESAATAIALK